MQCLRSLGAHFSKVGPKRLEGWQHVDTALHTAPVDCGGGGDDCRSILEFGGIAIFTSKCGLCPGWFGHCFQCGLRPCNAGRAPAKARGDADDGHDSGRHTGGDRNARAKGGGTLCRSHLWCEEQTLYFHSADRGGDASIFGSSMHRFSFFEALPFRPHQCGLW
eukprot:symbB.v1.2.022213.t1/scaffold1959.1/size100201/5